MIKKNYIGNISTILKTILMMVAGWFLGYAASHGLNLPIDAAQLTEILFVALCFVAAYIDAKFPNSFDFLGNSNLVDMATILGYPSQEILLNEEYETEIEGDPEDGG